MKAGETKSTVAIGALKLEGWPRHDGTVQVVLHSTTGMQELSVSAEEWRSVQVVALADMIAKKQREIDVEALRRMEPSCESWQQRYEKAHADCQEMIRLNDELTKEVERLTAERDAMSRSVKRLSECLEINKEHDARLLLIDARRWLDKIIAQHGEVDRG